MDHVLGLDHYQRLGCFKNSSLASNVQNTMCVYSCDTVKKNRSMDLCSGVSPMLVSFTMLGQVRQSDLEFPCLNESMGIHNVYGVERPCSMNDLLIVMIFGMSMEIS